MAREPVDWQRERGYVLGVGGAPIGREIFKDHFDRGFRGVRRCLLIRVIRAIRGSFSKVSL